MTIELNNIKTVSREFEKKQRKFDQQLNDERQIVQKITLERDQFAQESRDRETKILSLNNELEQIRADLTSAESTRRMLQLEYDELVSIFSNFFYNFLNFLDIKKR